MWAALLLLVAATAAERSERAHQWDAHDQHGRTAAGACACNLTGTWQAGSEVYQLAYEGNGSWSAVRTSSAGSWHHAKGRLRCPVVSVKFDTGVSDTGTLDPACDTIQWNDKSVWGRASPPFRIQIHIVEHTHDDVGWLETIGGYYLDRVRSILDEVGFAEAGRDGEVVLLELDLNADVVHSDIVTVTAEWAQ